MVSDDRCRRGLGIANGATDPSSHPSAAAEHQVARDALGWVISQPSASSQRRSCRSCTFSAFTVNPPRQDGLQSGSAAHPGRGSIHCKPSGPRTSSKTAITVTGQKGGGPVISLHQTRSNNADHAMVPMALRQQQKGRSVSPVRFEGHGLRFNRIARSALTMKSSQRRARAMAESGSWP